MNLSAPQSLVPLATLAATWALYGLLHSLLASRTVKALVARRWPRLAQRYRLAFNVCSALWLIPPLALSHALAGETLWAWRGPFAWIANGVALTALATFLWTTRYYDMREFLGLSPTATAATAAAPRLCLSPLHRHVRHPWYFLALLILWTRDMDAAGLTSALALTAYIAIGARLEERKLVAEFGATYRDYQARVPALVPRPGRTLSAAAAEALMRGGTDPA